MTATKRPEELERVMRIAEAQTPITGYPLCKEIKRLEAVVIRMQESLAAKHELLKAKLGRGEKRFGAKECDRCEGAGVRFEHSVAGYQSCVPCNGEGWISLADERGDECPSCEGHPHGVSEDCTDCNGTGILAGEGGER